MPVDITTVTDAVLNITNGFLINRNLIFTVSRANLENPYVLADAVRIREVLVNILGNAVKFTGDGGAIHFETDYRPGEDAQHIVVRYRITDNGVGMSKEFVERIFEEFAREDNGARTQYKGTGLGMAITKQYVDMMDGTISVENKKGKGSAFTVELPMELTDAETVSQQELPQVGDSLRGIHVLMAEDNDLNAEIAEIQLEEVGIQVTRAVDGQEAVNIFAENSPGTFDIILMDIMMPGMNGYEAANAIRTSNQIERLNKELKRRSKVIGVFPNEDSVLRLMGSVLIERHDAMLGGRAVFSKDSLSALLKSDIPAKLIVTAEEQRQLRAV